jgi:hypothetical protein
MGDLGCEVSHDIRSGREREGVEGGLKPPDVNMGAWPRWVFQFE